MPVLGFLLSAFGFVRKAARAALDFVREKPALAAIIALVALSGWLWWGKSNALDQRDAAIAGRAEDRKAYTAAQVEARRLALAAKAATEARYKSHAERIDSDHETELADARSDTERFIAARRLRPQGVAGSCGGALAAADNRDPGVLSSLPADSVVVDAADVRACSDATAYALSAREWALGLAAD